MYRILKSGPYADFSLNEGAFFLAVLALSIVSASLSYFVVEKPILRYKNTLSWWRRS
jgi:peptidoglycan/LPS O-acetylase OafA/YrhL